jgi:hypothetical protein
MRSVAEIVSALSATLVCIHGIDEGDALALATRFDRGWAYRGAQALLWDGAFEARAVHDRYLPRKPLRPRRGLLGVDGKISGEPLHLVATQFSLERTTYIGELRYARRVVRQIQGRALLFVDAVPPGAAALRDPDFELIAHDRTAFIAARGIAISASIVKV